LGKYYSSTTNAPADAEPDANSDTDSNSNVNANGCANIDVLTGSFSIN